VITRNENDPRSLAGFAKKLLQHIIMRLQPKWAPPDAPEIDDIADEIDCIGVVVAQEIKKGFRLTCPCAQMQIRDEKGPELALHNCSMLIAVLKACGSHFFRSSISPANNPLFSEPRDYGEQRRPFGISWIA
jgi:hypothetical protein